MNSLILKKEDLNQFLSSLQDMRLIAPVKEGEKTFFREVNNPDNADIDLDDYTACTKEIMFPQTETMFAFSTEGGKTKMIEQGNAPATVVFGIRPCDAKSFLILDPLFKGETEDPYYLEKREATVLIGLSCKQPTSSCFCTSLGGGPASTEGLDLLFTDIGDGFFVKPVSDKGLGVIKKLNSFS